MTFITNNFTLSTENVVSLYKERWNIECFFKWIKQNIKIKHFYSNTENDVKIQIWTAIITYLLICILRKKLNLKKYTISENKNLQKSYDSGDNLLSLLD